MADIALAMFFTDVKALVKSGVERDMACEEEDEAYDRASVREAKKLRKTSLQKWHSQDTGLLDYGTDNYATLLRALTTDPQQITKGLPGSDRNILSPLELATILYSIASDSQSQGAKAPVLSKGVFLPSLKEAVRQIEKLAPQGKESKFTTLALKTCLDLNKVKFIPWKKHYEGAGRQSTAPVWDSWAVLSGKDTSSVANNVSFNMHEEIYHAANAAQEEAMSQDPNASWTSGGLYLKDLPSVLIRTNLPDDWKIPESSSDYVLDTYNWATNSYDASKPVHQLALIVGILMSKALPNIHAPPEAAQKAVQSCTTRMQTREAIKGLPWVEKNKKKGSKETSIFVVMFTTFIMALYDRGSPLRKYMTANNNSLGPAWTEKHRELFPISQTNECILLL